MSDHVTVIPVFNEAATIGGVGQRAALPGPVTVVDDGSWDGSDETAAAAGAVILRTGGRLGKGGALRLGFAGALARTAERVVTLDGDGQHDPDDIPRLLAASEPEPDALVIGGRLSGGGSLMEPARLHALRVAGFFIDWLTARHMANTRSAFRVYPRELLERVSPGGGGFVFETEVLVRAAAAGYAIREVSISSPRPASRPSRFRPLRDGVAVTGYLAVQGLRRWASDAGLVARSLARPFTGARRRPRHAELARFTTPYRHNPGALASAFRAGGGLGGGVAGREVFPRFHIGESPLPANLPVLDRLGVRERIEGRGFILKYGAAFHDQESDLEYRFYFQEGKPWPDHAYEVPRAEFDQVLLEHAAAESGVSVLQPATVERVEFDSEGVTAEIREGDGRRVVRARFLVDATGRAGFISSRRQTRRTAIPGLGKVSLFAHFEGAPRWPGREGEMVRVFVL